MRPRYYYDGGPFAEATIHRNKHCSELETPKPLAASTVGDIDANHCDKCGEKAEGESEQVSDESETEAETCEVEMDNGDTCGRETPCPYHDKR